MEGIQYKDLEMKSALIRKNALIAIQSARSGHIGGSLSVADILSVLYFAKMKIDPAHPDDENRDRFVLSKGHCTPALYSTLALRGFFPLEDLKTFRHIDSNLSGHAEMNHIPGVDMSAGSLGQGFSAAVGMALSGKIYDRKYRVYTVLGDGEIQEGQIWEAAMAAGNYKLDNLTAFVDNNNLQIDGTIEEVMSPYPIDEKFKAFKWHVITVDGHDIGQILSALAEAEQTIGLPTMIVAKTIKGKGVSFMENNVKWHGNTPSKDEYSVAFQELDNMIERLDA